MKIDIHFRKRLPVILHILAWFTILFIPFYLDKTYGEGNDQFLLRLYINIALYGILFYINYLILVPKLYFNDKRKLYFLIGALLLVAFCTLMWFLNEHIFFDPERDQQFKAIMDELNKNKDLIKPPPVKQFKIYNYFYTSVLISGFSLGLGVLDKLSQNERQRKELEKEKLNSELALLKNQISPHFFFNTLNNIYTLIKVDTDEAQDAVHQLSKLMRYLLYESEHEKSKLSDELLFLNNYINLMKLRLNDKVNLEVSLPEETDNIMVPPLLFIAFVENAFKHGVSYRDPSFIKIRMTIENDKLIFVTQNSILKNKPDKDNQYSGIGLENIKKRLRLLYPGSHQLTIDTVDDVYTVKLILNINEIAA